MTKKMMALFLVLTLAIAVLCGCSKQGSADGDLLNTIKQRGYIIVGTEGTWSPYTYHDDKDQLVGFEVEVAKYIADYIGVDIQYTETAWSSIFAALDAGQIDIVANSVSYNEERAQKYDFSEPYNYTQYAIMTLVDNDEINSLADVEGKFPPTIPPVRLVCSLRKTASSLTRSRKLLRQSAKSRTAVRRSPSVPPLVLQTTSRIIRMRLLCSK